MAKVKPSAFTAQQRTDLSKLGLRDKQVAELEGRLRYLADTLCPKLAIGPTRKRLMEMDDFLRAASDVLPEWEGSPETSTVLNAWELIRSVSPSDPGRMEIIRDSLDALRAVIVKAREALPKQQRKKANIAAIREIATALMRGFCKHHNERWPPMFPASPLPPYTVEISRANPFAEIVRISYDAAGHSGDPDNDIRAFLKQEGAWDEVMRRLMGLQLREKRRGRPRKRQS